MNIYYIIGMTGISCFAISASLAAAKKKMDIIGALVLSFVTACGGGTLRDILLNRDSIFWVIDTTYLWVCILSCLFTTSIGRYVRFPESSLNVADAFGVSLFVIQGIQIAQMQNVEPIIALTMGLITGFMGGVLRDTLSNEIPTLFRPSKLYFVPGMIGGACYISLKDSLGTDTNLAAIIGIATISSLRLISMKYNLNITAVPHPDHKD